MCDKSEPSFKVVVSRDVIFNESEFSCLNAFVSTLNFKPDVAPSEMEHLPVIDPLNDVHAENANELSINDQDDEALLEIHDENVHDVDDGANNYQLIRDMSKRIIKPPEKFNEFQMSYTINVFESLDNSKPNSYCEAIKSEYSIEWLNEIKSEMNSLHADKTWILVHKPDSFFVVDCKWLFKVKHENPLDLRLG